MVAKITSGNSLYGVLAYNRLKQDEGQAKVIGSNLMLLSGGDPSRLDIHRTMQAFEPYLVANRRTENPIFHVSLNPHPKDRLSEDELREIAREYMEKMGYGNQPYIVFRHDDIRRSHIHIVSVRVDREGKKIGSAFEARRSMKILREIERKYRLHPAVKGQRMDDLHELRKLDYSAGNLKRQLSSIVREASSRYDFLSVKEFNTLLNSYNVYAEAVEGEKDGRAYHGIIYGALDETGERVGVPIKSSRIGKDVGFDSLQKKAAGGSERLRKKPAVKRRIMGYIADAARDSVSKEDFIRKMEERNITVFFRESAKGRIYGTTFIDHDAGIVLNGSRLGKAFSSNVFEELFNDPKANRRSIVAKMEEGLRLSVGIEMRRKHDDSTVPWMDIVRDATNALNIFATGFENQPIPIEEWEDMQEEVIHRKRKLKKKI